MATVYLLSVAPNNPTNNNWSRGAYERIRESALHGAHKQHTLTDDPHTADIILFAELGIDSGPFDEFVRYHPLFKQYPEKCFLFMNNDNPVHFLRGIYTGLARRWYRSKRAYSGFYINSNTLIDFRPWNPQAPYLFCFCGAVAHHPARQAIAKIQHPRFFLQDTGHQYIDAATSGNTQSLQVLHSNYAQVMADSQFVLCPRGVGASSIRLFETLQMGRIPVIISDDWVPPVGPDWPSFSIRIPENEAHRIPEILEAHIHQAPIMAALARKTWEQWFAPSVYFHTIVEWCLRIQSEATLPEWLAYRLSFLQLLKPSYLRRYLRSRWTLYRQHQRLFV